MRSSTASAAMLLLGALAIPGPVHGQDASAGALVTALRQGGYALIVRHASSPREVPDERTANPDNVKRERQLDDAGRVGAIAMGEALRALQIPIGDVLTSPTYRAIETAQYAKLPNPQSHAELGDRGRSMQGVSEADGDWLRKRAAQVPDGTNTVFVTHMPNIARAFPDWGAVADGEVVVARPDGQGGLRPVGRITIDEWARLPRQLDAR